MTRRRFGFLLAGLLLFAACAKKPWMAPISELEYGLEVVVKEAYVQGDDTLEVKTTVVNKGDESVRIDRSYWALELPTGEALRHEAGSNITIAPGGASDVDVSFELANEGFKSITSATLIVGGVHVGDDPSPYPAGEIPLSRGAAPSPSASARTTASAEPPEPAPKAPEPAPPSPTKKPGPTTLEPEPD